MPALPGPFPSLVPDQVARDAGIEQLAVGQQRQFLSLPMSLAPQAQCSRDSQEGTTPLPTALWALRDGECVPSEGRLSYYSHVCSSVPPKSRQLHARAQSRQQPREERQQDGGEQSAQAHRESGKRSGGFVEREHARRR